MGRKIMGALLLAALVLPWLGCNFLTGEDAKNGKNGGTGDEGPQGPQGLSVVESLPCVTGCIDGDQSIKDAAVDTRVLADGAVTQEKIGDGAVGTAQVADQAVDTMNIAIDAVGAAQIADLTVTGVQLAAAAVTAANGALAPDAVTSGNLAADAVQSGDIAPNAVLPTIGPVAGGVAAGAVGPGDIGADAVIPADGATPGSIAPDAVDTHHLADGAVYRMWTMKGTTSEYTTSSAWQDLNQMSWPLSNGDPAVYTVFFNGTFYAASGSNTYNDDFEVRIVEMNGASLVDVKTYQTLTSNYEPTAALSWCYFSGSETCYWYPETYTRFWSIYCYPSHAHATTVSNFAGSVLLTWAGYLDPAGGHTLKVQYRSITGQEMHSNPTYGDRILTVMEMSNALLTVVP
ncbi:MAG TPA: hypothetical protein VM658_18325 [bacterium]|nr:hypothetical protein [bacterium]